MGKKQFVITAIVGIVMFGAGFGARMAWEGSGQEQTADSAQTADLTEQDSVTSPEQLAEQGYFSAEMLQIRVDDGQVQWYDGRMWHAVAMVEELAEKDRFYLAEEAFAELNEQLRQESAAKRQQEDSVSEESGALLVGQKESPKPTARPSTATTTQRPTATPVPEATPADSGWNDNHESSGGRNDNDSPAAPSVPSVPDVPQDSGGGDAGDAGDTGDGENMEWTDDYL